MIFAHSAQYYYELIQELKRLNIFYLVSVFITILLRSESNHPLRTLSTLRKKRTKLDNILKELTLITSLGKLEYHGYHMSGNGQG